MPGVGSVQASEVRAAISRAASRTGVDFNYLMAQARIESGFDPQAQARTSSARGLYQFVDSTWLRTVDKHGAKHGLAWAGDAVTGSRITDASLRADVMALRDNPEASALMAAELALDNRDGLRATLGREPDNSELYLAHFLGLGGAQGFLSAVASTPGLPAEQVNPAAARANRSIFFDGARARTVAEVMDVIREKMNVTSGISQDALPQVSRTSDFMRARAQFEPATVSESQMEAPPIQPVSMADTLRCTFSDDRGLGAPAGARVARPEHRSRRGAEVELQRLALAGAVERLAQHGEVGVLARQAVAARGPRLPRVAGLVDAHPAVGRSAAVRFRASGAARPS